MSASVILCVTTPGWAYVQPGAVLLSVADERRALRSRLVQMLQRLKRLAQSRLWTKAPQTGQPCGRSDSSRKSVLSSSSPKTLVLVLGVTRQINSSSWTALKATL